MQPQWRHHTASPPQALDCCPHLVTASSAPLPLASDSSCLPLASPSTLALDWGRNLVREPGVLAALRPPAPVLAHAPPASALASPASALASSHALASAQAQAPAPALAPAPWPGSASATLAPRHRLRARERCKRLAPCGRPTRKYCHSTAKRLRGRGQRVLGTTPRHMQVGGCRWRRVRAREIFCPCNRWHWLLSSWCWLTSEGLSTYARVVGPPAPSPSPARAPSRGHWGKACHSVARSAKAQSRPPAPRRCQ